MLGPRALRATFAAALRPDAESYPRAKPEQERRPEGEAGEEGGHGAFS